MHFVPKVREHNKDFLFADSWLELTLSTAVGPRIKKDDIKENQGIFSEK